MMEPDHPRLVPEFAEGCEGRVRCGLVEAAPVAIGPSGDALVAAIEETCSHLARRQREREPTGNPAPEQARALYRAFGIDPTRHRPSSEALLRRVCLGKGFPRISNAVDLCNLLALRFLLSPGLYDADRLVPPITLRRGMPGESYEGIRKDRVNLEGRPVLADARGPFGNPTSDSRRTCVTASTRALWFVLFAPGDYPAATLEAHVNEAREAMAHHLAPAGETVRTTGAVHPPDGAFAPRDRL